MDIAAAAVTTVPLRTGLTPASILGPAITTGITLMAIGGLMVFGILHRIPRPNASIPRRRIARPHQMLGLSTESTC